MLIHSRGCSSPRISLAISRRDAKKKQSERFCGNQNRIFLLAHTNVVLFCWRNSRNFSGAEKLSAGRREMFAIKLRDSFFFLFCFLFSAFMARCLWMSRCEGILGFCEDFLLFQIHNMTWKSQINDEFTRNLSSKYRNLLVNNNLQVKFTSIREKKFAKAHVVVVADDDEIKKGWRGKMWVSEWERRTRCSCKKRFLKAS